MSTPSDEQVTRSFPAENIRTLNITCKNYCIHLTQGTGEEICIRYHTNRFRTLRLRCTEHSLYLEEQMAVTFYDLLRLIELMDNNALEIQIPARCGDLIILAETGVTEISADEITAQSVRLQSASGSIRIRNLCVGKSLYAHSTSGRVSCVLPGTEADYDIDCRAERRDMAQPWYAGNRQSERKIVLRSNMTVPELMFTGERMA